MTEPKRDLPNPTAKKNGDYQAASVMSPKAMTTRGAVTLPARRVIPVIVVPGIMGSNLRAHVKVDMGRNLELKPGKTAWRPPNGTVDGLNEVAKWKNRNAAQRQRILSPSTLEVDEKGEIDLPIGYSGGIDEKGARSHWWGEIHWDSYGKLLYTLAKNLNSTFFNAPGFRAVERHWDAINRHDRREWNAPATGTTAPLTIAELEKFAGFQYPVYACGYNWLQSNEESADRLLKRVEAIIDYWASRKHDCKQVIIVTHSMGGLAGRACAKRIPEKILGVVHGVMPALGAPLCYRRIACGTETSSPSASWLGNKTMDAFATIAGKTQQETTPVMATAPGPLELLPNHLYPGPWLFVAAKVADEPHTNYLKLPTGSPYDLYRDTRSWYRLIDPELVDPANQHNGTAIEVVKKAIKQAERFHMEILDTYYHPNSYAFYGNDTDYVSFGSVRWLCDSVPAGLSESDMQKAKPIGASVFVGGRNVEFKGGGTRYFWPAEQDTAGDGTVPRQSGAGPIGKVKDVFATQGYDHQGSYSNEAMLALAQHLIVKIVQEVK